MWSCGMRLGTCGLKPPISVSPWTRSQEPEEGRQKVLDSIQDSVGTS